MDYFSYSSEKLSSLGAGFTAKEIWDQPSVWTSTYQKFLKEKGNVSMFMDDVLGKCEKILLTGAGTSAYIGDSLEGSFQRNTGITTISVPTTHLVTHPGDYLLPEQNLLVISFARSGNSPESVAAVKLIDQISKHCVHLIITCDGDGQLARYQSKNRKFNFILPPESNDKSLAMTSSFTSMLLSGLLFSRYGQADILKKQVEQLVANGEKTIKNYYKVLSEVATLEFERAVFLGSGPMFGTAMESGLKLQELTDGMIICKTDSFLGFRHGPKAVIDEKTIVIFLFSNKDSVLRYERDLVQSIQKGRKAFKLIGVSHSPVSDLGLDVTICISESKDQLEEEFMAVCSVLPAQMLGMFKSLALGLKPDNPSVSGAISRVVEGVVIYEQDKV